MADARSMILQGILSGFQQPTAQLGETNAAAGAAGASAANSMSEVQARQQQLAQHQFMINTQALFDKSKGKSGYVDPNTFNEQKKLATQLDITGDSFDEAFKKGGYVDPNKEIYYNTADGVAAQQQYSQTKRQIESRLDAYNSLPADQKGVYGKANIPNLSIVDGITKNPIDYFTALKEGPTNYLKTHAPEAYAYDQTQGAFSAQLKDLAGAGTGSGVRANQTELDRWAGLVPPANSNPKEAASKIQQLDANLKAKYNIPVGLDPQYLPNKGRPSLSSFGQ